MAKTKKPRKIKYGSRKWHELRQELLEDFMPEVRQCKTCGGPVHPMYCCTRCGEVDP